MTQRLSLGFTGTQQGCTAAQLMVLTALLATTLRHNDIFRHGDCVGADEQAHHAARLIACPAGPETVRSGAWSTVRYARSKGMSVTIVWPSGEVLG